MSRYTTELKSLLDNQFDIGLTEYPIYDEAYRAVLNKKIIDHYLFCEIGAETPARFRHYLNRTMNEIMPLYNQLYASAAMEINPFYNVDLTETLERESEGESQAQSSGQSQSNAAQSGQNLSVQSDTPQNLLSVADINANLYASQADRGTSSGTTTSSASDHNATTSSGTSMENYIKKLAGTQGVNQSESLIKFRETFLNIDMMIIDSLKPCFMGVW